MEGGDDERGCFAQIFIFLLTSFSSAPKTPQSSFSVCYFVARSLSKKEGEEKGRRGERFEVSEEG